MFRFTIRDVVLLTLVVAIALGWLLDHVARESQYSSLALAAAEMRDRLDAADPGWDTRGVAIHVPSRIDVVRASPIRGYLVGAALFALAIVVVTFVWQGRVHWLLLKDRPGT